MTDTTQTQTDMALSNAASRTGTTNVRNVEDHLTTLIEQHIAQVGRPDPRVMARLILASHADYMAPAVERQHAIIASDAADQARTETRAEVAAEVEAARAETAAVQAQLDAKTEELNALKTRLHEATGETHGQ